MSTSPVMTVTDELLEELEYIAYSYSEPVKVYPEQLGFALTELRRLRAENAGLGGLLREAGKTIHKLQAEQPTPLRIARYLDAMRAKIDAAMGQPQ